MKLGVLKAQDGICVLVSAGVISCARISFFECFPCFSPAGNAALVLRSRLKVKVVKEHRDKSSVQNGIEENGVVSANLEKEVGKQIMQYQVRGKKQAKKKLPKNPQDIVCNLYLFH